MTEVVTTLTIDARGYTLGAAEVERATRAAQAAIDRMIDAEHRAATARNADAATLQKASDSIARTVQQWDRLRASTDQVAAAEQRAQQAIERASVVADSAMRRGVATAQEAAAAIARVRQQQEQLIRQAQANAAGPVLENAFRGIGQAAQAAAQQGNTAMRRLTEGVTAAAQAAQRDGNTAWANMARGLNQAAQAAQGHVGSLQRLQPYMANLTAQANDVAVSLVSGQKPWLVMIQQGAQVQGIFQQAGVSLRAFINPLTIAIASVAVLGGGFAVVVGRAIELERQLRSMKIALDATAGASGLSAAAVQAQVLGFARTPGVDREAAAAAATNILRNPLIDAEQFRRILPLARDYAAITGTDIPAAANALADGLTGGYAAALKLDQQFQFLTVTELNLIRTLEEQGRSTEAANVMLQAMERHAKGVADQGVLPLDKAAKDLTNTWNAMLDSMAKGEAIGFAKKQLMELIEVASGRSTGAGPSSGLPIFNTVPLATQLSGALARLFQATPQNDLNAPIGHHPSGYDPQKIVTDAEQAADAIRKLAQPADVTGGALHKLGETIRVLGDTLDPAGRKLQELSNIQDSVTLAFRAGLIPLNEYMEKMAALSNMKLSVPTIDKAIRDAEAEATERGMSPAARARAQALRTAPEQFPTSTADERRRLADARARGANAGGGLNLGERIRTIDAEVAATQRIIDAYAKSEAEGRKAELQIKAIHDQHKLGADAIAKYVAALEREDAARRQRQAARDLRMMEDEITGQEKLTAALAQSTVEYAKQKIAVDAAAKARQGYSPEQVKRFEDLATRRLQDDYKLQAINLNRQLDPVATFNDTIAKLEELKKQGILTATAQRVAFEDAYIKMARGGESWIDGAIGGLMDFARQARNVGEAVASALVGALQQGTDALAKLMVGMSVNFKSLLQDLRLSLARAFIGSALTGPLAGLLGGGLGALGGIVPGMGGVGGVGGGLGAGGLAGAGGSTFTGGGLGDIIGGIRSAFGPGGFLGGLFGGGGGSLASAASGSALSGAGGAFGGGMNWMGGIGGLLGGALNFAQGNTLGGIAGLIGGALSFIPGLGPLGGIIGALGGILGGLLKKKPKAPQAVSNLIFGSDGWTNELAMSRGKGNLGAGTGKAAGAVGDIIDELAGLYGLGLGPGTTGGFLINSVGKKTGNLWQVGLGTYANPQQLPAGFQNGGSTVAAAYTSPEEAISALAAMIVKAGAAGGTLTGLTATQQRVLRSEDVLTIESIKKALDFSTVYDDIVRGQKNVTAAEKAIRDLNTQFRSLKVDAERYGLDVGIVEQRRVEAMNKLATDVNDDYRRRLLGMTPEGQLQVALEDPDKAKADAIKNAQYLNATVTGALVDINQIESYYAKQRVQIIEQANQAANNELETLWRRLTYGDLSAASPLGTLEGTRSAYHLTLSQAQGGDLTARANLAQFAEDYVTASYRYSGSDPRTAAVVASVRDAIAPFFTANDNLTAASTQFNTAVTSYARIQAEQAATIDRLIATINAQNERIADLTLRLERLAA